MLCLVLFRYKAAGYSFDVEQFETLGLFIWTGKANSDKNLVSPTSRVVLELVDNYLCNNVAMGSSINRALNHDMVLRRVGRNGSEIQ